MRFATSAARWATLLGISVLLASVIVSPTAVPLPVRLIVPALVAGVVAWMIGRTADRSRDLQQNALDRHDADLAALTTSHAQLRHDLRGMLSPALLNADRLSTNTDPAARRAAEAMIVAIERMEQRLRDR